jgi:hypothetical protein
MIYGLFDRQDKCWLGGTDAGPNKYDDDNPAFAKMKGPEGWSKGFIAATLGRQILAQQLDWPVTRIQVVPFDEVDPVLKDKLKIVRTPEEAIGRVMEGKI